MTASTPQSGAPRRRRIRPWHIVLIALGGMALFGAVLWMILSWALGPLVEGGDAFMRALKEGDHRRAYALAAPALQRELGDAGRLGASFAGRRLTDWRWSQRSIRNGAGYLSGRAYYEGPATGYVSLDLREVDGQWRVVGYRFTD